MNNISLYADGAQARDQDRRMVERFDDYGRVIRPAHEFCRQYDEDAIRAAQAADRAAQAKRVAVAIGKMEKYLECRNQ